MLIIVLLADIFKLYYSKELIQSDVIWLDDKAYVKDENSKKNEGFIGFFDWLRKDEGNIVGVRLCYFEHQNYNSMLSEFPYVNIIKQGEWIEILFKNEMYINDISGDQDFTNNYVFKSSDSNFLLTFGLDHLTEAELNNLIDLCELIPPRN